MDDYEGIHIKFFSVVVSILMTFSDVPEQMIRDITTRKWSILNGGEKLF